MIQEENYILLEPQYIKEISDELDFKTFQVENVLSMIKEGDTVPFIARYRKTKTNNLDEEQIRSILELNDRIEKLYKAKQTAINGIKEQGKMTSLLFENIVKAKTLKEVEDLYKPYKLKKKTKAMIAIEKGFQVVADMIKENRDYDIPSGLLEKYSEEEIIEGAINIISAEVSSNSDLREDLLETLDKFGTLTSKIKGEKALEKLNEKNKGQIGKFDLYKEFEGKISNIKSYQILAINRGEKLEILSIKIPKTEDMQNGIKLHYARILEIKIPFIGELEKAFLEGFDALFLSVENETRGTLTEKAENEAIESFSSNLYNLLMTKPNSGKNILAIDPGFAAGCKLAFLDDLGNPKRFEKIYIHKKEEAKILLKDILEKNKPEVIVIGNGTGSNESVDLMQEVLKENKSKIEIVIVNESGASVYSASEIANEEFKELDSLERGTISIGRRYIDPLSELVKVPVGSIGVGMYQHDVSEKKLEEKLGYVVEDVVNDVGINVNTASSYVLNHISGIDKRTAKKIFNNRPYKSRIDLKKQISEKVYEQAIGFLRVPDSKEKLDNTDIHPEQYLITNFIISNSIKLEDYNKYENKLKEIYEDINKETFEFILKSYNNIGLEKRINSTHKLINSSNVKAEIKIGDIVDGIVRNVVAFGAFVDIGMKNDGLVHISQIADAYVSDPREFVEVGQNVKVKVTGIDDNTGKIQLSMKEL